MHKVRIQPERKKMSKPKKIAFGVFMGFAAMIVILVVILVTTTKPYDAVQSITQTTSIQAEQIKSILKSCGIDKVKSISYDKILDNLQGEGSKGYRLSTDDVGNIILYLNSDNTVSNVNYAEKDLYTNGNTVKKLSDLVVSFDEKNNLNYHCIETVKKALKAPSTAKFPSILDWSFSKDPDKQIITVSSYVDSENSFGAMLRSSFKFEIKGDTIQTFILDGKKII